VLVVAEDDADVRLDAVERLAQVGDRALAGVEAALELLLGQLLVEVVLGAGVDQLLEAVGLAVEPVLGLGARAIAVGAPLCRRHGELGSVG
jgi:hypothetical protein